MGQSIPAMVLAGITLYAGVFYLAMAVRHTRRRLDLSFALTCLAVGAYDLLCAGLYSALTPREGAVWQRAQMVALAFVGAAFLNLVADYTRRMAPRVRWFLTAVYLAFAAMQLLASARWLVLTDQPAVKDFFLLGRRVTYQEVELGPLTHLQAMVSVLILVYVLRVALRVRRDGDRRRARPLLTALALFIAAVLNDSAVAAGLYPFVYLFEYAYMGMVLLMALSLSGEVAEITRTKASLGELERRFEGFFRNVAVGLGLTDREHRLVMANPGLCRMFGVEGATSLLGASIFDHFHPDDRSMLRERAELVLSGRQPTVRSECRYLWPDRHVFWCELSLSAVFDTHGRFEGVIWILVAATERRQATESLRTLNERLEELVRVRTTRLIGANRRLKESLRKLREDEEAGRRIQVNLLPPERVDLHGVECAHRLVASQFMSGDFVDYFRLNDRHVGFYAADVSGHGVSSAFVTVFLKSFFLHNLEHYATREDRVVLEPARLLAALNAELMSQRLDKHVALFYGLIDTQANVLQYSSAGQLPYPLLLADGRVEELRTSGTPVGMFDFSAYTQESRPLPPAFSLTVFSDGVLEIMPSATTAGKLATLNEMVLSTGGDVPALAQRLGLDRREAPPDDVTILTVRRA